MTDGPIMIPCEGSGCPGHPTGGFGTAMCSCCGVIFMAGSDGVIMPEHDRDDLIARLVRGDFDWSEPPAILVAWTHR
jgi:ferredoxin